MTENSTKDIDYIQSRKIIIGNSKVHFRGVFATDDIEEGELIERCPMVPLSFRAKYQSDPQIWNYLYGHTTCDCKECKTHGFIFYMVLGYGMIYNHQDSPNTRMQFNYANLYVDIIAETKILKGEEIFVTYGDKYFKDREKIDVTHAKNN